MTADEAPSASHRRARASTLVIIPAKDEEAALPSTLAALRAAFPPRSGPRGTAPVVDVVVIDDGSTDTTAAVAEQAGATVLSLPFNLGIGGALQTGFRYAVRYGYERAVQLDADGQHDPDQITRLLAALDEGADLVIGNRFGGESHTYELGRVRARAMAIMRFVVRQFSGQRFADTSSGFRAFNAEMLAFFARDYPAEYLESVEALLLATTAGYIVAEVPVRMHNREQGLPSNRNLRLLYHYLRLLLVITVSVSRRKRIGEAAAARQASRTPNGDTPALVADAPDPGAAARRAVVDGPPTSSEGPAAESAFAPSGESALTPDPRRPS